MSKKINNSRRASPGTNLAEAKLETAKNLILTAAEHLHSASRLVNPKSALRAYATRHSQAARTLHNEADELNNKEYKK